ncbi:hypothetical protein ACLRGI_10635 [Paenarthrobacter nitroguajacolicus]|uniref:hypothetical protein n=1 Tax=Paenarthrobacter nitroguajacolicus TaxID=211146 RepID=UPI003AD8DF2C
MAAAAVSLPSSTGVFQLEVLLGLALVAPGLVVGEADGITDGFSDPEAVSAVAVASDGFDAALPAVGATGATVTNWVTAGCCGT